MLTPKPRRPPAKRPTAVECKLDGITRHLERMEKHMIEQLATLLKEVRETRGQNASMLVLLKGIPGIIQAAVDKVLADHPTIAPEDLQEITDAAAGLDTDQQEIQAAIDANA